MKNLKAKNRLFGLIIAMGAILFMPSCEDEISCELTAEGDAVCVGFALPFKACVEPITAEIIWAVEQQPGGDLTILNQDNPTETMEDGFRCETVFVLANSTQGGTQGQISIYTEAGSGICYETQSVTIVDNCYCCYEYQAVPKYFPSCFTECTGGLDNTWEILQFPCEPLPEGFESAFANVTLNSSTSLGNCGSCSNPVTSIEPQTSFNLSVCGPLDHSISFDIHVYDEEGNLVSVCPDQYFSFNVPECN